MVCLIFPMSLTRHVSDVKQKCYLRVFAPRYTKINDLLKRPLKNYNALEYLIERNKNNYLYSTRQKQINIIEMCLKITFFKERHG